MKTDPPPPPLSFPPSSPPPHSTLDTDTRWPARARRSTLYHDASQLNPAAAVRSPPGPKLNIPAQLCCAV